MTKTSGLGDALYVDGYDISGDIGALGAVGGGPAALDVTGLRSLGFERIGGLRDGRIEYAGFFNGGPELNAGHLVLSPLTTGNRVVTYCRGEQLGSPAAVVTGKVADYPVSRGNDGALSITGSAISSAGHGLEWGELLTAGIRADTTATAGASLDGAAATAFGLQAYLQIFALTGTNVVVTLEDSANNSSWTAVTGAAFTSATTAPGVQRLQTGRTAAVRRYVRAVTTGTFTAASFAVVLVRNAVRVDI